MTEGVLPAEGVEAAAGGCAPVPRRFSPPLLARNSYGSNVNLLNAPPTLPLAMASVGPPAAAPIPFAVGPRPGVYAAPLARPVTFASPLAIPPALRSPPVAIQAPAAPPALVGQPWLASRPGARLLPPGAGPVAVVPVYSASYPPLPAAQPYGWAARVEPERAGSGRSLPSSASSRGSSGDNAAAVSPAAGEAAAAAIVAAARAGIVADAPLTKSPVAADSDAAFSRSSPPPAASTTVRRRAGRRPLPDAKTRRYPCLADGCTKVFGRKSHRERHMNAHAGTRPFKCPSDGCTGQFTRYDNMMQHFRRHH